jgi:hypothetical protein
MTGESKMTHHPIRHEITTKDNNGNIKVQKFHQLTGERILGRKPYDWDGFFDGLDDDILLWNKETGLSLACSMSHHDVCIINIQDVRKCGCNCHHHTVA